MIILVVLILYCSTNIFTYAFISTDSNVSKESKKETKATKSNSPYERMYDNLLEDDIIYQVSFPTNICAHLDPGNISGRGQVFSDKYEVKNYGNTDVVIKIKNITVLKNETISTYSNAKEVNINIIWENKEKNIKKILPVVDSSPEEYVLYLKAAQYDENGDFIAFHKGSTGIFYFKGMISSRSSWEDDELSAVFDYEITNIKVN